MNIKPIVLCIVALTSVTYAENRGGKNLGHPNPVEIRFTQHHFVPQKIEVPAGEPLAIHVVNASRERIEFESFKLNREKVVEPGASIVMEIPALRAGTYDFYDDFHDDVPEGTITAR